MKRFVPFMLAIAILLVATPAFAGDSAKLVRHVPKQSQFVIGVEMAKVKNSFLFQEALTLVRAQAGASSVLAFVVSSGAFDLEKEVSSVLVSFGELAADPTQAGKQDSTVVLRGTFDQAKVRAAAEKQFGSLTAGDKGGLKVFTGSGLELAFTDANTMVIADQGAWADATWKAQASEGDSAKANKELGELIKLANTDKGVWAGMLTTGMPVPPDSPQMDGASITLDVSGGIAVDFRSKFAKAEDANKALDQLNLAREQNANNPMVSLVGATPLVQNLKTAVLQKRVLKMTTSMTNAEVKAMLAKVKAMNEAPPSMPAAKPIPGQSGGPAGQPAGQPTGAPAGTGAANADFN